MAGATAERLLDDEPTVDDWKWSLVYIGLVLVLLLIIVLLTLKNYNVL
jgi:hypothetical protein